MSENENIENTDQQNEEQSCCSSGDCSSSAKETGKMKYAAFGFIMLLAVGVAANALIEKHKGISASTCGTNACTTCPSQLGGLGTCDDSDNCSLAPKPKETAACCPSQTATNSTCSKDSAAAGCQVKKDCCGSEGCKVKAEAAEVK